MESGAPIPGFIPVVMVSDARGNKTGWLILSSRMPFGEIVPLYGVYAEGFWDRELTPMPDGYWTGFQFSHLRTDNAIGSDILGTHEAKDPTDADSAAAGPSVMGYNTATVCWPCCRRGFP